MRGDDLDCPPRSGRSVRVGEGPETVADSLAADGLTRAPRVTGHQAWTAGRPLKGPAAQHPEQEGAEA
jgi:hypothetical protein